MNTKLHHTPSYYLNESGRMPVRLIGNIDECLKQLRGIATDELKRARRVSKQARKHKIDNCHYLITLGRDQNSALWTRLFLTGE